MTDKKGFIYTILIMSLLVLCSFFMFVESIISLSLVLDDNKLEKIGRGVVWLWLLDETNVENSRSLFGILRFGL